MSIEKIPLSTFQGKFISETDDDICFEVHIGSGKFREFFPKSASWHKKDEDKIYVHKHVAKAKGLLGNEKANRIEHRGS